LSAAWRHAVGSHAAGTAWARANSAKSCRL